MKKLQIFIKKSIPFVLATIVIFLPVLVFAQETDLIVCEGPANCDFPKLVELGIHIMNFLIVIAVPLAAIAFVVAGFKLITSAGNESGLSDAKKIFTNTAIGLVIVLIAWLVVKTILIALLGDPSYSLLEL